MKERVRDCIVTFKHTRAAAAAVKLLLKSNEEGKDTCLDKQKNQRKTINIFLPITLNIYFCCSK